MTDERNLPIDPVEDPALHELIASAGRIPPHAGFEDRVIRSVALPLPPWAIRVRNFRQSLLGTRLGQLALVAMTLGCVTSVTLIARWTSAHFQTVQNGLAWVGANVGFSTWQSSLRLVSSYARDMFSTIVPEGLGLVPFAIAAGIVVPVSAVGLYITAGPRAVRSHENAR